MLMHQVKAHESPSRLLFSRHRPEHEKGAAGARSELPSGAWESVVEKMRAGSRQGERQGRWRPVRKAGGCLSMSRCAGAHSYARWEEDTCISWGTETLSQ